jgi:hypothetical protein
MVRAGTLVRILYPDYATGMIGRVQAKEISGRWIVQLRENPFNDSSEPLLLSLEETDFEVIESSEGRS